MLGKRKASQLTQMSQTLGSLFPGLLKRRKLRAKRRAATSAKPRLPKISKDPFPKEWRTKLTWNADTQYASPGSTSGASVISLTSLYDPDYSNHFGNFQPMCFDQVLSATGPYQNYRVNSWKGKITITNVSAADGSVPIALECYFKQGATNAVDVDTWSEIQSQTGVQTLLLGPVGSDSATKTIYFNGSLKSFIPADAEGEDFVGSYNSVPSKPIYAGFGYRNAKTGSASVVNCYIKVSIEYDVTLYAQDGVQS